MTDVRAGWEVEGFIDRLSRRDDTNSERLVLEAISHLRAFSRDCDALRETNARLRLEKEALLDALTALVDPALFDKHPEDYMPVWHKARDVIRKAEETR